MKSPIITKFTLLFAFLFILQNAFCQKPSKAELPSTYDFDYLYKLKMTHKKGDVTLDYYLKENAKYFGFDTSEMTKSNQDTKMFMVMDGKRNVTAMFMDMMGKKIVRKSKLKNSDFGSDTEDMSGYSFTKIDSKTINNYECEGYISENDKYKITFYITDDVPVSFTQVFRTDMKNMPKGFNPDLVKKYAENGLMMEMIFEDKKRSKNNVTMKCLSLEKTDFSLNTTKYGSMMGAFGG